MLSILSQLAIVSIPTVLLFRSISNYSTLGRYYIRLGIYLSTVGLCCLYGALVSVPLTLVGKRFEINWVVARTFYNIAGRALAIQFEVEGEHWLESARPAVVIGNHQSMLDLLLLGRIFPHGGSICVKEELRWVPFLGQYLTMSGAVFLERSNNMNAIKSLVAAGNVMKKRRTSLWLFPEGTRSLSSENKLLPFKKGAFHLAVQVGIPIVPVVCENYSRLYGSGKLESGKLRIRVLEPISTANLTMADVPDLAVRIHDVMEAVLREISRHGDDPKVSTVEPSMSLTSSRLSFEVPTTSHGMKSEGQGQAEAMEPSKARRQNGSEAGSIAETWSTAETESDEGMVIVGRPN